MNPNATYHTLTGIDGASFYYHQCMAYSNCVRSSNPELDVLFAIKKVASASLPTTKPTKDDWDLYVDALPSIAKETSELIMAQKIKYFGKSAQGNVFLAEDKYKVIPDYFTCNCPEYRLLCVNVNKVTCPHVLAAIVVNTFKLVQLPEDPAEGQ